MDESQAITIIDTTPALGQSVYSDDLEASGRIADYYAQEDTFSEYHQARTPNTKRRQLNDLTLFSTYLAAAHVSRAPDDLYQDARAWKGTSYGHVKGFRNWLLKEGFAIGSINTTLATIRQYCSMAKDAGMIDAHTLDLIRTVENYNHKVATNIDDNRKRNGQDTRKGLKKATPTYVSPGAARTMKKATIRPELLRTRAHDKLLSARDNLLMCLLIEHALRVSEIAALNVEHLDMDEGVLTVYRIKTKQTDQYKMPNGTFHAARAYLDTLQRTQGPLFTGYQDKRISTRAINDRVGELGRQVGIEKLSPHDLRHFWTIDALKQGTPLDIIQAYGGWSSPAMLMHYAKVKGKVHEGLKISE